MSQGGLSACKRISSLGMVMRNNEMRRDQGRSKADSLRFPKKGTIERLGPIVRRDHDSQGSNVGKPHSYK